MTREEAVEEVNKAFEPAFANYIITALIEGATVSDKEPFKPMVEIDLYSVIKQKYIEREVLDKIRAEIEPTRKMYLEMNDIDWLNGCDYVLSVIEKYKAKSEPQESEDKV